MPSYHLEFASVCLASMRSALPKTKLLIAILTMVCVLTSQSAHASIEVVSINDTQVNLVGALGGDFFTFSSGNDDTAFFFGNQMGPQSGTNLDTANRVPLSSEDEQYFQATTIINVVPGIPEGSTIAYWFDSSPFGNATPGTNFSTYDANQDGTPDTVFMLDFGPTLSDPADDIIRSYAYDLSPAGIDLFAARAALSVPEPTSAMLLALATLGIASLRRRIGISR